VKRYRSHHAKLATEDKDSKAAAEVRQMIPDLIVDEPLAPLATPVHSTAQRFGKVDNVYIHTAKTRL